MMFCKNIYRAIPLENLRGSAKKQTNKQQDQQPRVGSVPDKNAWGSWKKIMHEGG